MDSGCWRMKFVENEEDIRKGPWTLEEDSQLIAYVRMYGAHRWGSLSKLAGLKRDGKSCRMRGLNYLRPDVKHGTFTTEEDYLIIELHNKWGNRWSLIAKSLPGRTDNEIKNHWRTHIKKMCPESCSWPPSSKSKAQIKAARENLEASSRKKKKDMEMSAIKEECSALNTLNNDSFDTSEFGDVHQALQDPEEMHQELLKESSDVEAQTDVIGNVCAASMLQHSPIFSWRDVTESPLNALSDSEELIWDYNSIDLWNLDDDVKNMDNQRQ